jgi:HPt (histidine-containing phosphotransfer) domain-containing protein
VNIYTELWFLYPKVSGGICLMTADLFSDRLARVRDRFASTLVAKIDDVAATMPNLAETAPAAAAAVAAACRTVHGMVGVGPAVGFPASGDAAREIEDLLRPPQQQSRGLTADEIARLTKLLATLRLTATQELECLSPARAAI